MKSVPVADTTVTAEGSQAHAQPSTLGGLLASLAGRARAHWQVLLALALTIPALLPLAAPGYFFNAHDAHHSVFYLVEFDQAIHDGALWPIWGPDHALGFGYPLWLIYAPLAYFVAEAFHLLGLGLTSAVKATWALSFVVGALGAYRLGRRWWGPGAAIVVSLAFTYAPYHLVEIYVRAALAEFVALAWIPWVLLAFFDLWDDPRPRSGVWAAVAFAALLLTHTVSALIFVPLLGGFVLFMVLMEFHGRRRSSPALSRQILWSAGGLALGVLLAAIFVVPMFFERRFIEEAQWVANTYEYSKHFVYPNQFLSPFWGFGYSVEGPGDAMSLQLGLMPFIGAAVGALAAIAGGRRGRSSAVSDSGDSSSPLLQRRPLAFFMVAASLITVFLMTPASKAIWDVVPMMSLVQFPWRLLAITVVTLALLAGAGVRWLDGVERSPESPGPFVFVFSLAIVLASFPYTRPELVLVRPQDESPVAVIEFETKHPEMRGMTNWSQRPPADTDSPLLPQYLAAEQTPDKLHLDKAAIVAGEGVVLSQSHTSASATARVRADGQVRLRFYTYYFPGWQATVDGRPATIEPDPPNGLIGLSLPPGEHDVQLHFESTALRRAAMLVSLAAFVGVLILAILDRKAGKRHLLNA